MSTLSTPAIILRRIGYGDYDLILSLITLDGGKKSAIAKSAKKSRKRFGGILEPFSVLEIVLTAKKGAGGLPLLKEAALKRPFPAIGTDLLRTAYASYWAELINNWMEESKIDKDAYALFEHSLSQLDTGSVPPAALSIVFQMRFISLSGYGPNLTQCGVCKRGLERIESSWFTFDIKQGELACDRCRPQFQGRPVLSVGTIKQLLWIASGDLSKATKIRLGSSAIKEGLSFLEVFVPYHLGREPRSLAFLRRMRGESLAS